MLEETCVQVQALQQRVPGPSLSQREERETQRHRESKHMGTCLRVQSEPRVAIGGQSPGPPPSPRPVSTLEPSLPFPPAAGAHPSALAGEVAAGAGVPLPTPHTL